MNNINDCKIYVYNINNDDNYLNLFGKLTLSFSNEDISTKKELYIINKDNEERFKCNFFEYQKPIDNDLEFTSDTDIYSRTILNTSNFHSYEYRFEVNIPLTFDEGTEFCFEVVFDDFENEIRCNPKIKINLDNLDENNDTQRISFFEDDTSLYAIPYNFRSLERKFKFSIIMAIHNSELYLRKAIESVINQTIYFESNIQLILVDDGSSDESLSIANEYYTKYPNNIILLSTEHKGQSSARNLGLRYVRGEYVNFLDSDDYISENTLKNVYNFYKKHENKIDVVSIPMYYFEREEKAHELNYKFSKTRILDLVKHPNYPQLSVSSSFIRSDVLHEYNFDENLAKSEDALLMSMILLRKKKYGVVKSARYYYRKNFDEKELSSTIINSKKFYTDRLKRFHKTLLDYCMKTEGKIPSFIQYMLAYELQSLLRVPELEVFDTKEEKDEFWYYVYDIIGYIGDKAILKNRNIYKPLRSFYMFLRRRNYHISIESENIMLKAGDYLIDTLNKHKIGFDVVEVRNGYLHIMGHFVTNFNKESVTVNLICEDLEGNVISYDCECVEYYQDDRKTLKFLSIGWRFDYNFEVSVAINKNINWLKYTFEITYNENDKSITYRPDIGFRLPSGLSQHGKYFVNENQIIHYYNKSIYCIPYKYIPMLKLEYHNLREIYSTKQKGYDKAIFYRMLYLILYPFMKNMRIWIFNDRMSFADDNAKHLYKYASKQRDGVRKYFVIGRESDDYKALKKSNKNILAFGSFKHKILFFFAEKHISAFVNEDFRNPFYIPGVFDHRRLYSGLNTSRRYFLQHGITLGNVTRSLKKYNTNLSLIVTASDYERQSFFDYKYNYDENIIQTLGLPRYDNLTTDDSKKQIVFMPSWRGYLDKDEEMLVSSPYYHSLNAFLNNEELHEYLEDKGYTFVFKPHPELVKHLELFDINENIYLSSDESYQDLFRDSSILITDYSSVAFDFAYLKKPVIYYQPNDDYPYEKGYFDFETMGFGDVIIKEEELIRKIKTYLDNEAVMEDKYKERVNDFFTYNDRNNCKRVYDRIYND